MTKFVVDGLDVLKSLREAIGTDEALQSPPAALWITGRHHEFTMAPGRVQSDGVMNSCMSYRATIDYPRAFARGLICWEEGEHPSGGVRLERRTMWDPVRREVVWITWGVLGSLQMEM